MTLFLQSPLRWTNVRCACCCCSDGLAPSRGSLHQSSCVAYATDVFSFWFLSDRAPGISLAQLRTEGIVRLWSHLWYIIMELLDSFIAWYPRRPCTLHFSFEMSSDQVVDEGPESGAVARKTNLWPQKGRICSHSNCPLRNGVHCCWVAAF